MPRSLGVGSLGRSDTVRRVVRNPWLDNAKFWLVTFVVVGHAWGQLEPGEDAHRLYDFVYAWHIPAFVLVSGHLSRSVTWSRRHLLAAVTMLLVPYLLFEPALYFFRRALGQSEDGVLWLEPHWTMWYLIVLLGWRLAAPLLVRHWLWVPASVAISLAAGLLELPWFDLNRFFGLLPFFVMGLHLERRHLARLAGTWWLRLLAVAALAWIYTLAGHTDDLARTAFLYYDRGYATLGYTAAEGAAIRLAVMGTGILGSVAVLALVPRRRSRLTALGGATMVVYLFHGFAIRAVEATGVLAISAVQPLSTLVVTAVGGVALSILLASPPVARRLGPLTDPLARLRAER